MGEYRLLKSFGMGDTILTTRQTAGILKELEHAAKSVSEARRELIEAMAARKRVDRPDRAPAAMGRNRKKAR
jgi:hypothetical protein